VNVAHEGCFEREIDRGPAAVFRSALRRGACIIEAASPATEREVRMQTLDF
jgi:hypothetical protein